MMITELQRPTIQIIMRQKRGGWGWSSKEYCNQGNQTDENAACTDQNPRHQYTNQLHCESYRFCSAKQSNMVDILRNKYSPLFASFRKPYVNV